MHSLHRRLVDEDGRTTRKLKELLSCLGLQTDGSLSHTVKITQEAFFPRDREGQPIERWELSEIVLNNHRFPAHELDAPTPAFRADCLDLLGQLGMLDEVSPLGSGYDNALLLGGLIPEARGRLAHLVKLWSTGCPENGLAHIWFDNIVFFAGEHLLPDQAPMKSLLDADNGVLPFRRDWTFSGKEPRTELEMMQFVWDQAQIPDEMRQLPVTWVKAPTKPNPNGRKSLPRRPNTGDTFKAWLKDFCPSPSCCVAISDQPNVGYQDAVLQTLRPPGFTVETVGAAASLDHKLALYFRQLAACLWQLEKCLFATT